MRVFGGVLRCSWWKQLVLNICNVHLFVEMLYGKLASMGLVLWCLMVFVRVEICIYIS